MFPLIGLLDQVLLDLFSGVSDVPIEYKRKSKTALISNKEELHYCISFVLQEGYAICS